MNGIYTANPIDSTYGSAASLGGRGSACSSTVTPTYRTTSVVVVLYDIDHATLIIFRTAEAVHMMAYEIAATTSPIIMANTITMAIIYELILTIFVIL